MSRQVRKLISSLLVLSTTYLFLAPQIVNADDHVVQAGALHQAIMNAAQARLNRIETLEKFFSSETARKALRETALDPQKIEGGVTLLGDEELANLSARAEKIQTDFAAGALSNQEITYIIIALSTAVLILIIVAAR
jgi:hypothetical protein